MDPKQRNRGLKIIVTCNMAIYYNQQRPLGHPSSKDMCREPFLNSTQDMRALLHRAPDMLLTLIPTLHYKILMCVN